MQIVTTPPSSPLPSGETRRDFVAADAVLEKLQNLEGYYYLGDENIASKADFLLGSPDGNRLILKTDDPVPSEFLLSGVFEIDKSNFFMTADGGFNIDNAFGSKLVDVKANCRLIPICHNPDFGIFQVRQEIIISNIWEIEKMGMMKGEQVYSILQPCNEGGINTYAIKLSHSLFKVRRKFSACCTKY
jgi:hypothetical protein